MTPTPPWTCPTCRLVVDTPYCGTCGEEPLRPRHLTLRDLAHQLLTTFTSIDGKLIRTLRRLLLHPGDLTEAYVEGRRKPFLGPLSLFVAANALFFTVQSFVRSSIFATPLDAHLHRQDWSALAQRLTAHRLAARGMSLEVYSHLFDQAVELNAKSLIILMVFAFSILLPVLFFRSRHPFAAHVVFSLHLYAFVMILFCVALGAVAISLALGGPGLESEAVDKAATLFNLACFAAYLYAAIGHAYGSRGVARLAKAGVLALAVAALTPAYRFAVFLITLYTT